ncbi:MAG TPA: sigma-70 family RNA polymerase sigma factor [Caulobacteraceae bacterium]
MSADGPARTARDAQDPDEAAAWDLFKLERSVKRREALFNRYFPFARQLARRQFFNHPGGDVDFAELCQLASTGLLEAIDRYDPDYGVPFRGYAARRINGSILDGLAKMSEVREQVSFRSRVRAERTRSLTKPDADALPVADAMQALIDLTVGLAIGFMLEGGGLVQTENQADGQSNAYDSLAWKETIAQVSAEVSQLSDREQTVIRQHYGAGLTFDRIGALLGVSRGRVSQLHRGAIETLRRRLPQVGDFHLKR